MDYQVNGNIIEYQSAGTVVKNNRKYAVPKSIATPDELATGMECVRTFIVGDTKVTDEWLTFEPPAPPPAVELYEDAIQEYLNQAAKSKRYDSILSCCSYANSTNSQFRLEGTTAIAWRDAVWAHAYAVMAEVQAGLRGAPTVDGLISELPQINW